MDDIVIISAVRTPIGKFQGALSDLSATELGAMVVREAVKRADIDRKLVDECIMGNVVSAGLGQNPARQAAIKGGLDVVTGWKKVRHDPWHKIAASRAFNWVVSWMTGLHLHDHNCGYKAYRAEVFGEIRLYGELHRFVPVMAAGFPLQEFWP